MRVVGTKNTFSFYNFLLSFSGKGKNGQIKTDTSPFPDNNFEIKNLSSRTVSAYGHQSAYTYFTTSESEINRLKKIQM